MKPCFFVTDLHGHHDRYLALEARMRHDEPSALFVGGDILPHFSAYLSEEDFFEDFLFPMFRRLKREMKTRYPEVFMILGNDDQRSEETMMTAGETEGLWHYIHRRKIPFGPFSVYGYSCVPPTPFRLKDWERYDVSRFVDPGCIPPTEGIRSEDTGEDIEYVTIMQEIKDMTGEDDMANAIFLFHSPPYQTKLDRAALDGMTVDHVPLDLHVGSIAIRRFIEERQPLITLHGHIHESTRLTGSWSDRIGRTRMFNGATDSPGLSLITFYPDEPDTAKRLEIR